MSTNPMRDLVPFLTSLTFLLMGRNPKKTPFLLKSFADNWTQTVNHTWVIRAILWAIFSPRLITFSASVSFMQQDGVCGNDTQLTTAVKFTVIKACVTHCKCSSMTCFYSTLTQKNNLIRLQIQTCQIKSGLFIEFVDFKKNISSLIL